MHERHPTFPQCGFSSAAAQILKACGVTEFLAVNVLENAEIRQGHQRIRQLAELFRNCTSTVNSSAARTSCARCSNRANCSKCCKS